MSRRVAVVDYGMGNLRSVSQAVMHVAASTPPGPSMSEYRPDMSVMMPIRITSPETWAWAGVAAGSR